MSTPHPTPNPEAHSCEYSEAIASQQILDGLREEINHAGGRVSPLNILDGLVSAEVVSNAATARDVITNFVQAGDLFVDVSTVPVSITLAQLTPEDITPSAEVDATGLTMSHRAQARKLAGKLIDGLMVSGEQPLSVGRSREILQAWDTPKETFMEAFELLEQQGVVVREEHPKRQRRRIVGTMWRFVKE
jgi:hypothetical protein